VKHCGRSYEEIDRTLDRDTFMTADMAREFGLIDQVFEKRPGEGEGDQKAA